MGVTPLIWKPAPPEVAAKVGDEHWPLLDDLLVPSEAPFPDPGRQSRHEALRALIHAAFGS